MKLTNLELKENIKIACEGVIQSFQEMKYTPQEIIQVLMLALCKTIAFTVPREQDREVLICIIQDTIREKGFLGRIDDNNIHENQWHFIKE